ncbi:hypothetical protein SELMODRAFT_413344 [Selaginella moellendorffii]|uniref:Serine-threonine/tyrosine-protein kinase catalytic domain-containing protein n=1 Tax=Selaginella moellendorffii TaxID=88036 RepID=D8RP59_SELML|nr:probable receptor-like protein kinase At5g39030 [Selaginella moellendorffii]EFJ25980.1 hypothetical protein SELMODRAFT_413344 [Selaginella moellendorffii]|eukprot:XP_002972759.1 probable receptor-like protein kinase At5g39030 [Selaginella moellendorffii]
MEVSILCASWSCYVASTRKPNNRLLSTSSTVETPWVKAEDGGGLSLSGFENIIRIGLWCGQEDPLQRPTMSVVVKMLESAMDVLAFPQLERPAAQDSSLLVSSSGSGLQISISVSDLAHLKNYDCLIS